MSIKIAGVQPSDIKFGSQQVKSVYAGSKEAWEIVTSPFLVGTFAICDPERISYQDPYNKFPHLIFNDTSKIRVDLIEGIKAGDFVVMTLAAQITYAQPSWPGYPITTPNDWMTDRTPALGAYKTTRYKTSLYCGVWPGGGQENNPVFIDYPSPRGLKTNYILSVSAYRGVSKLVWGRAITLDNTADLGNSELNWNWPNNATMPSCPASTGPSIVVAGLYCGAADWVLGGLVSGPGPTGFTVSAPALGALTISNTTPGTLSWNHSHLVSEESEAISPGLYHLDGVAANSAADFNGHLLRLGTDAARSIADAKIAVKDKVRSRLNKKEVKL